MCNIPQIKYIITLCASFIFFSTFSQTKITLRITNEKLKPIPFVSAQIKNTSIGTITNTEGNLELFIPKKEMKNDFLLSCIGYKTIAVAIDSILKVPSSRRVITLKDKIFNLSEITVHQQKIEKNPQQIIANAIDSISKLLDPNPNIGKYYFRQIHRDDSTMNRIVEAAVSIYDPGINHDMTNCKFNIDELKSSLDNRVIDYKLLLNVYWRCVKKEKIDADPVIKSINDYEDTTVQKHLREFYDKKNSLFSSYFIKTNMIRGVQYKKRKKSLKINPYFTKGRPIITYSFLKEHQFKLDTILLLNEEPVYKIKILPNKKYPKIRYQEKSLIPIGTACIRVKDFAFLNFDYGYISNPNRKYYRKNTRFYYRFKMEFKEYNNQLYLSYLYSMKTDYNHKYYTKRKNGRQRIVQELINTKIIQNKKSINQQLSNLKWNGNQYQNLPFNQKFWKNYSIMLPTQEETLLKDDLIKSISKKN